MNCNICNSTNISIYDKIQSSYIDEKYTLYACSKCKSFFFNEKEHSSNLSELYNNELKTFESTFKVSKKWLLEVDIITRLLGNPAQTKISILDIGCRTGDFLNHWEKQHDLYGVELTKANAKIASSRGIKVYNDFIENIDFDMQFDVVACYALLEHIATPNVLLDRISALLKPNGVLVIMIPSIESKLPQRLFSNKIHWHMFSPPEHLSFYSREFLDSFFVEKGLSLVSRKYTSGGLGGRYSKMSRCYHLLKNPTFDNLKTYYTVESKKVGSSLKEKMVGKYYQILEKVTPITKYPYFDHMYSYYRKER